MGDTLDHLPPVGTSIRTYAQGCCTKTVLHKYNTQTSECVLAIPKSDMTLTTTIENMNRNAVRKNRLTSYETSIVNHSVEWLEHSESGEDVSPLAVKSAKKNFLDSRSNGFVTDTGPLLVGFVTDPRKQS